MLSTAPQDTSGIYLSFQLECASAPIERLFCCMSYTFDSSPGRSSSIVVQLFFNRSNIHCTYTPIES